MSEHIKTFVFYYHIAESKFLQRDVIKAHTQEEAVAIFDQNSKNCIKIDNIYELVRYT